MSSKIFYTVLLATILIQWDVHYSVQYHFSGNMYSESLVTFMNHHGGAGWSILRGWTWFSASDSRWFWCEPAAKNSREGTRGKRRVGEGWGSTYLTWPSVSVQHMKQKRETKEHLSALGPSWEHQRAASSGTQALCLSMGWAQLRNATLRIESQYHTKPLSPGHPFD